MTIDPTPVDATLSLDAAALAAMSDDWVCVLGPGDVVLWSNDAALATVGREAAALAGHRWVEVIELEDRGRIESWLAEAARAEGESRCDLRWRVGPETQPREGRLRTRPLPSSRRLIVVHDDSQRKSLVTQATRLREWLDVAREFGRLGVWEREIPSGKGQWDPHVFRFWGLDPQHGTPDFGVASTWVHPDDRIDQTYLDSTRRPGRYSTRYRIVLSDGQTRRIHSQWEVKADDQGRPNRAVGIMLDDSEAWRLARSADEAAGRLQLAAELAALAVWTHDLRTDRVFHTAAAWHFGVTPPGPEGLPIAALRDLIHPDDLALVVDSARETLETDRPVDFEARYRGRDGGWRHLLSRRVVQRDAHGEPLAFLGVTIDVTDRVAERRHSEELARRLDMTVAAAGVGLWSRQVGEDRSEWNAEMFRIYGRDPARGAPGFNEFIDTIHPDDRGTVRDGVRRTQNEPGTLVSTQFRIVRPDGSIRWIENRAKLEQGPARPLLAGVALDVTERVEAELALRSLNDRVQLATRGAGIGTWAVDATGGRSQWDDQMFLLRGLPPAAQAPDFETLLGLVHPDDRHLFPPPPDPAFWEFGLRVLEFRVIWPDGTVHWLASRSSAITDRDGRPLMRIGVNWDITEAKQAAQVRAEREAAVRESEAKSQFLARVSHELRTPLNAILGFAQLLELDFVGRTAALAKVANIRQAGEHLLELINDVLDLTRFESGAARLEIRHVMLGDAIAQALPLLQPMADQRGVSIVVAPGLPCVRADALRLRQVLINVIGNAIKFNRSGGKVRVEAHAQGPMVALAVHDDGPGIAADRLAQVGEPFNRLGAETRGVEGTGIGLTIVRSLVDAMNGILEIESQLARGTTVRVRLPAGDAALTHLEPAPAAPAVDRDVTDVTDGSAGASPAPAVLTRPPQRHARLLYIEDNPVNVLLLEEYVRSMTELQITSVGSGAHGVLTAVSERPDVVLIDMQLPDFDGYEVLRRLRADARTAGLRCVALSANAMTDDIERALAAGFDAYWTKPIDFRAFRESLDRLLERRG